MTTPTDPGDEPIEESVRQHLWRVRARLVTPPDEARAEADLDRLFLAAREHAHIAPAAASDQDSDEVAATPTEAIPARPGRRIVVVGQAAAAAVLLIAAGGVLSGLQAGGSASITALLSRDGGAGTPVAMDAATDEDAEDGTGAATPGGSSGDLGGDAADAAGATDDDAPGSGDGAAGSGSSAGADGAAGGTTDGTSGGTAAAGGDDGGGGTAGGGGTPGGGGTASSGGAGATPGTSTDGSGGSGSGTGHEDDQRSDGDDGTGDGNSDDGSGASPPVEGTEPPEDDPTEIIVALPDPGAVDGFGGAVPCPDQIEGSWCLPDGSVVDHLLPEEEEPATPTAPTVPETPATPTEPTAPETPPGSTESVD